MKGFLPNPDWEQFLNYFEKLERSDYRDTRKLALRLLEKLDEKRASEAKENKDGITTILELALAKVP